MWTATTTEAPAVGVAISNYAQHGYSSSPKTLKQVDDEVVQLAGNFDIYPFKQLNVINRIPATIITTASAENRVWLY